LTSAQGGLPSPRVPDFSSENLGLTQREADTRFARYGPNAIPLRKRNSFFEFAARLWGPIPWVLETTLILTLLTRRYGDTAAVAFLLLFNAIVAALQEGKARDAVELLRTRVVVQARVKRDSQWCVLPADRLVPGDLVHVGVGDIVPADVRVVVGRIEVDQSVLTGESQPRAIAAHETAYAGSTIAGGEATAVVTATALATAFGKTAELVRSAKTTGQLEHLILRLVSVLTIVSLVIVAAISAFALNVGSGIVGIAIFAVMILLASVPIALPAAFTLATTLGSLDLARRGALVTRLSALEDAASMDVLCTDKTGTLTENKIEVEACVSFAPFSPSDVAALAAAASDEAAQDRIDLAVIRHAVSVRARPVERTSYTPFDPLTKLSSAQIAWDGESCKVLKGAPHVIEPMSERLPTQLEVEFARLASSGGRVIMVAVGHEGSLRIAGLLGLSDPPRDDAARLIRELSALGVEVRLLTGDSKATALHVAREVGIPDNRVVASMYPADKLTLVKGLQRDGRVVGMTGDGVNDAPALRQANMGIAVSSATDVAKAAAGIVLTEAGLTNIVAALESSRAVFERMLTYTIMKLVKYFEIIGVLTVGFFATKQFLLTPELMVALLVFNDLVTLAVSSDNVTPGRTLDVWSVKRLLLAALPIALFTACSVGGVAIFVTAFAHLKIGALRSVIFLAMVVMGQLVLFIVRDRTRLFGRSPSAWLFGAAAFAVTAAAAMTLLGVLTPALPLKVVGAVLLFLGVCAVVVAVVKLPIFALTGIGKGIPRS
jgi:H+-transporting ATPase